MNEQILAREIYNEQCRWQGEGGGGPDPEPPAEPEDANNDVPAGEAA